VNSLPLIRASVRPSPAFRNLYRHRRAHAKPIPGDYTTALDVCQGVHRADFRQRNGFALEVMSLIIQHEYYRELLGRREVVRDVEGDATEADRAEEKVYE
jgi:hypothetical protein